jgi:hypothetical protein
LLNLLLNFFILFLFLWFCVWFACTFIRVRWSDPRDAERIGSSDSNMKKDSVSIYVAFTAEIPTVTINDVTLRNLFAPFGQLQDVSIKKSVMDRQSQCQRGYAFVCFPSTKQGVQMALHAATQLIDCHINGVHYHCEISNTLRSKLSPPMSMNGSPHPSTPSPVPTSGNVHPMQDVPQHPLASQQFVPVATSLPPAMAALPPSVNNATPMYMSWNQQYSSSIITNVDPAMSLQLATSPHMYLPTSAVPPVAAPPSSFAMHFPPQLPQPPLLMQPPSGMVYRSDVSPHASPPLLASYSSDASTIASTYSAPLTPLFNANNMGNGGNNGGHVPVYGFLPTVSAPATTSTGMMMMAPPMMVPAMPQYMISHPLPQQPVNQQPVSSHPSVMQVSFVPTPTYEYQHQRQHQHQQQQHQEQQQQHQEQQQQQQQQAYHHRLAY